MLIKIINLKPGFIFFMQNIMISISGVKLCSRFVWWVFVKLTQMIIKCNIYCI